MSCVSQFFQVWGDPIQIIALIATLAVIIWYACETQKLRRATVKQTKLQLTPYVILDYKNYLVCKNVGNSSALNVTISTLEVLDTSTRNLVFRVSFDPLYVLEPKEEKKIEYEIDFKDKELEYIVDKPNSSGIDFFPFFPEEAKKEDYNLIIEYKNLEDTPYITRISIRCKEKKIEVVSIREKSKRDEL